MSVQPHRNSNLYGSGENLQNYDPTRDISRGRNFLRKGMGNGGSSTRFQVGLRDPNTGRKIRANSKNSDSPDLERVPILREEVQVRVRTKNNSFVYHKDSLDGGQRNMSRTIAVESDDQ